MAEFTAFPKLARLSREIVITEKIDGTNAAVIIEQPTDTVSPLTCLAVVDGLQFYAQSRTRLITPGKSTDNFGFAAWVRDNAEQLACLGPGVHFGEWYGSGIQRNYGLKERRFALFNVHRWRHSGAELQHDKQCHAPPCCEVVPTLYRGDFDTAAINGTLFGLAGRGSVAAPGFLDPEGIVVFHTASGTLMKKTIKDDETPKSVLKEAA